MDRLQSSYWWGPSAAVNQTLVAALGIQGTILGTVVGGLLTYQLERFRAAREQRSRWEQVRLGAYVALLQSTRAFMDTSVDRIHLMLETYQKEVGEYPPEVDEQLEKLEGTRRSAKTALAEIQLVAPPDVAAAARTLDDAVEAYDNAMWHITASAHRVLASAEETEARELHEYSVGPSYAVRSRLASALSATWVPKHHWDDARVHMIY